MVDAVAAVPRLADFEGVWRLERRIEDTLAGESWHLTGHARFAPVEGGYDYVEMGTLCGPGGQVMQAERRYLWRAVDGGVDVFFADGGFFHHIPEAVAQPEAEHLCGADLYRVRYDFTGWPRWQAEWRVRGPRKDYLLHSFHAR